MRFVRQSLLLTVTSIALLASQSASQALNVTWNVAGSGNWDTTTANWTGDAAVYTEGDNATFNNSAGGTITLTADRSPASTTFSAPSGTYTISGGNIVAGGLTLSPGTGGTVVLNSQYTATGPILVATGTTLRLGASERISNSASVGTYGYAGTLDMNGYSETIGNLTGDVNIINTAGLTINGGDRNGGYITGTGAFTKNTGAVFYFGRSGGPNTYAGGTFINGGQFNIYNTTDALPTTGQVTVSGTGNLNLELYTGGYTQTIGALNGNGAVSSSNPSSLTVGNGGGSGSFSGVYSGSNTLTKVGGGTQIMSGNNSYTGTTTINGGILQIDGTTSGQGNYVVNSGGTLAGVGTIGLAGGSVTVNNGGTLAPGASIGTLAINGDLILNSGALLDFEFGGGGSSDSVAVSGTLTLDGTLTVDELAGFGNGTYTLFTFTSLVDNGLTIVDPDNNFALVIGAGFINLEVTGVVPEPGSALMLAVGSLALAWQARRKRS